MEKYLGGFDASEIMTMATARELPALEERFTELKSEVSRMEYEISSYEGFPTREIAELQLKWQAKKESLKRLQQQVEFAQSCAKYVTETMGRNP